MRPHLTADCEQDDHCVAEIVAHTLVSNGIPARTQIVEAPLGSLPDVIARAADDCSADLVVIGDTAASWTSVVTCPTWSGNVSPEGCASSRSGENRGVPYLFS